MKDSPSYSGATCLGVVSSQTSSHPFKKTSLLGLGAALLLCASGSANAQTLTGIDLGSPSLPGSATQNTDGTTSITGGGSDIWNSSDNGFYYYTTVSSPVWDAVVRVRDLMASTNADNVTGDGGWSKVELMARQIDMTDANPLGSGIPQGDDAFIAAMTTRAAGQNEVVDQFRTARNTAADWLRVPTGVYLRPSYPNQWLRLQRVGSIFTMWTGTDGSNWTKYLDIDTAKTDVVGLDNARTFGTAWQNDVAVGIAVTAHDDAAVVGAIATISDWKLTVVSDQLVINNPNGLPVGFTIAVQDVGASIADPATAQLTLNGASVPVSKTVATNGITTFYYYDLSKPLLVGSTNTVTLTLKDKRSVSYSGTKTFVEPAYVTLPPEFAATNVDTTKAGFAVTVHQNPVEVAGYEMENTIARAEQQLFGLRGPNKLTTTTFTESGVINYNFDAAGGQIGVFQADLNNPGSPSDWPDTAPWNIDPTGDTSNIAAEMEAYVHFPEAGVYNLIFNSDDGFRTTASPNPKEVLSSIIVGQADVGKGSSDIVSPVFVPQAGYYPLRTIWFQGGGGANLEWSATEVLPTITSRRLLGDKVNADALKVYYARTAKTAPACVSFINPARDTGNPWLPNLKIQVELTDGVAAVDQGSIALTLNGQSITPQVQKSADKTQLTFQPASALTSGATYQLGVSFTSGGIAYNATNTFTVAAVAELPPSFALPAAAVDKSKTGFVVKTVQADYGLEGTSTRANYQVDGYIGWPNTADLSSVSADGYFHDPSYINYNGNGSAGYFDSGNWTETTVPGMPGTATAESGADNMSQEILTVLDLQPGYYCIGVNSDDGCQVSFGNPKEKYILPINMLTADYGRGMGDAATDRGWFHISQAGLYPARLIWFQGGGGYGAEWYTHDINPGFSAAGAGPRHLINDTADSVAVKSYEYPLASAGVPYVAYFGPAKAGKGNHTAFDAPVTASIADGVGNIDLASVKLKVDGAAVTPVTAKNAGLTTVTYKPASAWTATNHTVELTFGDRTVNWSFAVAAGAIPTPVFWVEAEDFDFGGGQNLPEASQMPYLGGAYASKMATVGVDFSRSDDQTDGPFYRVHIPNGGVPEQMNYSDLDRGGIQAAVNFRIGWVGNNQWYNYTRTFPAGKYNVYAAASNGGTDAHGEYAQLHLVTAGIGTANQTVQTLGTFDAKGTGGWGLNTLVPLKDDSGNLVALDLSGKATLRYTLPNAATNVVGTVTNFVYNGNGDWDYMLFVPAQAQIVAPRIDSIIPAAGGKVVITWSNAATLQSSPDLTTWTDVPGATSPATIPVDKQALFFRVKR